jgi:hypothetical protein
LETTSASAPVLAARFVRGCSSLLFTLVWRLKSLMNLKKRNPMEGGRRKGAHHQLLTEDVGHPALAQHIHAAVTLMRVSKTWSQFKLMLDVAHPKRGDTLQLPLMSEPQKMVEEDPPTLKPEDQHDMFAGLK